MAQDTTTENTTKALTEALRQVFGENTKSQKFIDVSRIPLICKNIESMHKTLGKLEVFASNQNNWNKEFDIWKTTIVSPLINQESDKNVERKFAMKWLKYLGSIIGTLATVGLVFNYVINPFFKIIR